MSAGDAHQLAASLAPVLVDACANRLSDIRWFRTDWQRGGAATAIASYADDEAGPTDVVLKFPIVERELRWIRRLDDACRANEDPSPIGPRLIASGDELGGHDIAWIVIEHLPCGPLGGHWDDTIIPRVADAAARFHACAATHPIDRVPLHEPWDDYLPGAMKSVKANQLDHRQRWTNALKTLGQHADALIEEWRTRPMDDWVHGDLHFANAMTRSPDPDAPVVLIDFAEVRAGSWIEDAIYLERQLWARPERMKPKKPLRALADARKALGLEVGESYPRLAMIRRALYAASAPYFIKSEGSPRHLEACLNRLEQSLAGLK